MKSGFLDKLLERLDKLDPKSLQTQFLRLAQEKGLLETIFQSIQEGVIVVDGLGRLSYANRASEKLLGFDFNEVEGRPVSGYLHGIDWDRVLSFDENEWAKLISQEIEITYPEHRYVNFYIVPLALAQSPDKGAVIILRDITRNRMQEASLVESERLNAIKLLAAGVAHEIGNPLNALNIHLQLLEREIAKISAPEKESLSELAGIARNEVGRLDLIITQFLRAIRPSSPSMTLSSVETVLNEALTLLRKEIQDRKIEIEIDTSEPLPRIHIDRDQIKQVFFNVTRNAFQAMRDGGRLTIRLFTSDLHLGISFRDTGVGIKPADFGHIFDPYYTTKPDGSGLGLMIVQRIIQDHGGEIEVVSKPDAGTSVTLLLPLVERRIRLLSRGQTDKTETEPP